MISHIDAIKTRSSGLEEPIDFVASFTSIH